MKSACYCLNLIACKSRKKFYRISAAFLSQLSICRENANLISNLWRSRSFPTKRKCCFGSFTLFLGQLRITIFKILSLKSLQRELKKSAKVQNSNLQNKKI
jgi:hypothetical protein